MMIISKKKRKRERTVVSQCGGGYGGGCWRVVDIVGRQNNFFGKPLKDIFLSSIRQQATMVSRQTADNYIRQVIHYDPDVPQRFKKSPEYIVKNEREPYMSIVLKIWRSKNFNAQPVYLTLTQEQTAQYRKLAGIVLTSDDYKMETFTLHAE